MRLQGANILMGLPRGHFDAHTHVFKCNLPMAPERRYTPTADAPPEALIAALRAEGYDGALLVQPSFLGTDNSYMLKVLRETEALPDLAFRGVAVVAPRTAPEVLDELAGSKVIGLRLNLIGADLAAADPLSEWVEVLRHADRLGWHVEVQSPGATLPAILPRLLDWCGQVVVDHFGLPTAGAPETCPGQRAILADRSGRLFVKVSAPYRAFPGLEGSALIERSAQTLSRLVEGLGTDRLLWGSDWPWTQHEGRFSYADTAGWERAWIRHLQGLTTL